jgi:hypothetical protein
VRLFERQEQGVGDDDDITINYRARGLWRRAQARVPKLRPGRDRDVNRVTCIDHEHVGLRYRC